MGSTRVVHDLENRVFELHEGDQVAGYAEYLPSEGTMAITHVVVRPEFGGRGHGTALARAALEEAKANDLDVLPFCWFVRELVRHNEEYLALVPLNQRRRFGLVA